VRAAVLLVVLAFATPAIAKPEESVAVTSADPRFTAALTETLASAGMTIIPVTDPPPAIADLADGARKLADREHATATVALVAGDDGATLLAYDRGVDRVLVRALPYRPPLTEAQGAEVARMARAMLRSLRVTPEVDLPPPPARDAAAMRARIAAVLASPALELPVAPKPAHDRLALDLGAGVRVGTVGASAGSAGSLAVIVRPDAIGAALAVGFVPAQSVEQPAFTGDASDLAIALTARVPLRIAHRIVVAGQGGFALHRIRVTGMAGAAAVDITRYDPAVRAGATAVVELHPGVGVGIGMSADGLLRRQDYSVGTAQVLDVPVAQLTIGIALIARIL
jgi:hypothetical protein